MMKKTDNILTGSQEKKQITTIKNDAFISVYVSHEVYDELLSSGTCKNEYCNCTAIK